MDRSRSVFAPTAALATLLTLVAAPGFANAATPSNLDLQVHVRNGDVDATRDLLRRGADPNAARGDGTTALHLAAERGDADVAHMLIVAGANVEASTRLGGYTPLLMAARRGSAEIVELLLEAGAEADKPSANGTTPLMFAAGAGSSEAIELLARHGAYVDAQESRHGQTPLMFAAAAGRAESVAKLLDLGAQTCPTTWVRDYAHQEKQERAKMMAKYRGETAKKEDEAKGELAGSGRAPADAKPDSAASAAETADAKSRELKAEAAQSAAASDQPPGKRRWWQRGKKGDAEPEPPRPITYGQLVGKQGGLTALHYAARDGHLETVRALVEGGAHVDYASDGDHTTPLLIASINGRYDVAAYLLARGAEPNIASHAGATPLYGVINVHWAPHSFYPQPSDQKEEIEYLELMEQLLQSGADPNVRLTKKVWYTGFNFDQSGVDETGATAFWRAAQAADVDAMRLLVEHGADPTLPTQVVPERRSPNGRNAGKDLNADAPKLGGPAVTPLQVATGAGYVGNFHRLAPGGMMPAVRYLVEELGQDVSAPDHRGYTPMHNAAARGDNEMILYLFWHGANALGVTRSGETTADLANGPVQRIQPFPETIALLESLGSENNDNCVSC